MTSTSDGRPTSPKIRTAFDRVNKETFVENMLRQTAGALASDAEFGTNSANQIRKVVEDLADTMQPNTLGESKSAGRAVVEARFALGADNSQYLSQAIALLWAGDGGERLRIVPPAIMPEIMRHASSEGIIRAMRSVMKQKRASNETRILTGLELAAWMMQVPEILTAVTDYMLLLTTGGGESEAAQTIRDRYRLGNEEGMQYVQGILQHSEDTANNYAIAKAILEGVYVLTDPESYPMQIVKMLLNASQQVVKKTREDAGLLGKIGAILGSEMQDWLSFSKNNINRENDAFSSFCPVYDEDGRRSRGGDNEILPLQTQFHTAVNAACARIGSTHSVRYIDEGPKGNVALNHPDHEQQWNKWGLSPNTMPTDMKWSLNRVMTPLWQLEPLNFSYTPDNKGVFHNALSPGEVVEESDEFDSLEDNLWKVYTRTESVVENHKEVIKGANLRSQTSLPMTDPTLASIDSIDNWIVDFCILRGLCGYKGPHQKLLAGDPDEIMLPYNYPEYTMSKYYKPGLYNSSVIMPPDIMLTAETRADIAAVLRRGYASTQPRKDPEFGMSLPQIRIDTDYVGYALQHHDGSPLNDDGEEKARAVYWAPINTKQVTDDALPDIKAIDYNDVDYSPKALNICEASMYEFMVAALRTREMSNPDRDRESRTWRAAAAAAKIRQLQSIASIDEELNDLHSMITMPADYFPKMMVTRPSQHCKNRSSEHTIDKLLLPVDSGIACFSPSENNNDEAYLDIKKRDDKYKDTVVKDRDGNYVDIQCRRLSSWLRTGMEKGYVHQTDPDAIEVESLVQALNWVDRFSLRIPLSADTTAFKQTSEDVTRSARPTMGQHDSIAPPDISVENINKVATHAILACVEEVQLLHEEMYIEKLETEDSPERQQIFGLNTIANVEDASRNRRSAVWSDAMREVAVSGDRLYRFVTTLTGAIGESADSALSWEDEDLKQLSKDAAARQKTLAERVSRFQTKLVESVVTSTLKGSKLQLDMRGNTPEKQQLVVLSTDVKDSIRQITDGEAGHGFFEAAVEINEALGRSSRPMTIHEIVANLQTVSQVFHKQISASMAPSSGASYSRVTEPRNSFMLHLKPDTLAAIQKAYDYITSEMSYCSGYHRQIHLWEFVEGKDWTLCTRFAELVGLMLQNTRMRSGSFAAYVGTSQLIANGHNIRMQIQRLRSQACEYLTTQMQMPAWLITDGRTYYFGGTPAAAISLTDTKAQNLKNKRQKTYDASAEFGGDDGDDRFDGIRNGFRMPIRRDVVNRMLDIARRRRAETRRLFMEGAPRQNGYNSLKSMLDYLDNPQKYVKEYGATRGESTQMFLRYMFESMKSRPVREIEKDIEAGKLKSVYASHTQEHGPHNRPFFSSFWKQLTDPNYKGIVRHIGPYNTTTHGNCLVQPETLKECEMLQLESGARRVRCSCVRVDIRGTTESKDGVPPKYQNFKGPITATDDTLNKLVTKALNVIFFLDDNSEITWRPHPEFKSFDTSATNAYLNVWVKPLDRTDSDLSDASRRVNSRTLQIAGLCGLSMFAASATALALASGALLHNDIVSTPAIGDGSGPSEASFNYTGSTALQTQSLSSGEEWPIFNWIYNNVGLGEVTAKVVETLETVKAYVVGLAVDAIGTKQIDVSNAIDTARCVLFRGSVEVRYLRLQMQKHSYLKALETETISTRIPNIRDHLAKIEEDIKYWKAIVDTKCKEAGTVLATHKQEIMNNFREDMNYATDLAMYTYDKQHVAREAQNVTSLVNASTGAMSGSGFDGFLRSYLRLGGKAQVYEDDIRPFLSTVNKAWKLGIDLYRWTYEDIVQRMVEVYKESESNRSKMRRLMGQSAELANTRERYEANRKELRFYMEFGALLAKAQNKSQEFNAKVAELSESIKTETTLEALNVWKQRQADVLFTDLKQINRKLNVHNASNAVDRVFQLSDGTRKQVTEWAATSYEAVNRAYKSQNGNINVSNWAKSAEGHAIISETFHRLINDNITSSQLVKDKLDHIMSMDDMDETAPYAFVTLVQTIVELAKRLYDDAQERKNLKHIWELDILSEEPLMLSPPLPPPLLPTPPPLS